MRMKETERDEQKDLSQIFQDVLLARENELYQQMTCSQPETRSQLCIRPLIIPITSQSPTNARTH